MRRFSRLLPKNIFWKFLGAELKRSVTAGFLINAASRLDVPATEITNCADSSKFLFETEMTVTTIIVVVYGHQIHEEGSALNH